MTNNANELYLKNAYSGIKSPWLKRFVAYFSDLEEGQLTLILPDENVVKFDSIVMSEMNDSMSVLIEFACFDFKFFNCFFISSSDTNIIIFGVGSF